MWSITATLYGHNLGSDETPPETTLVSHILRLEQDLADWQSSLPAPLLLLRSAATLPDEPPADPVLERFRLVLSLRHLSVRLLLYRPMLTASLSRSADASSSSSVGQMQVNFNAACVRVAEDIVDLIHAVLTRPGLGRRLIGAWWFTLYYCKCPSL